MADPLPHAPPSLAHERARQLMQWSGIELRQVEDMLVEFGQRVYLQTILAEQDRRGIDNTPGRVRDTAQAWAQQASSRVREIAQRDAASIVATRNRMITNAVDRALGKQGPTLDVAALVDGLQKIDDAYAGWKAEQINQTERYVFYQAAFEDFYQQNSDLATLFDFGGSLQCPLCQEIADAGPYTLQGMAAVDDPPHIGCLDTFSAA